MDIILIGLLILAAAGAIFYMARTRKSGGCASCPYNDGCGIHGSCASEKRKETED
ncbi:MAG: FeoB-associated Cys-rich membrane protein [Clostridia bacterium]